MPELSELQIFNFEQVKSLKYFAEVFIWKYKISNDLKVFGKWLEEWIIVVLRQVEDDRYFDSCHYTLLPLTLVYHSKWLNIYQ